MNDVTNTNENETTIVDGLETEITQDYVATTEDSPEIELLQALNDNQQFTNILLLILIGTILGFAFVKGMFQIWK